MMGETGPHGGRITSRKEKREDERRLRLLGIQPRSSQTRWKKGSFLRLCGVKSQTDVHFHSMMRDKEDRGPTHFKRTNKLGAKVRAKEKKC